MIKNEIHARLPPELMEAIKRICGEKNSNLSDVVRAALVLYVNAYEYSESFEYHKLFKSQDSLKITLIGVSPEVNRDYLKSPNELTPDEIIEW